MEHIIFHRIEMEDIIDLQRISKKTFFDAYGHKTRSDLMDVYLRENLSIDNLEKEWHTPESYFYFVIYKDEIAGYVKYNTGHAQVEKYKDTENGFHLERIYILQPFQKSGIGRNVLLWLEKEANRLSCSFIWLSVWDQNPEAIRFYERYGYLKVDTCIFRFITEDHIDYIMRKNL